VNEDLIFLFDTFEAKGKQLYIVGGAVRDLLLGDKPDDYDLATDAVPGEVMEWFPHVITKGKRFGTIGVILDSGVYEITTFRKDAAYQDGRHPVSVIYTDIPKEDVIRRDITINGLLMDRNGVIYDYVGGLKDMEEGLIRCIGEPDERFREDKLRKWRCIRIAAEKRMVLSEETRESIHSDPNTDGVSVDRIRRELMRIIMATKVTWGGYLLVKTDLMRDLLRRFVPAYQRRQHDFHLIESFEIMAYLPKDGPMRLSVMLVPMTEVERVEFLSFMKFPKKITNLVLKYCRHFGVRSTDPVRFKKAIADLGWADFTSLLSFQTGQAEWENDPKRKDAIQANCRYFAEIARRRDPIFKSELAINGGDVMELGYRGAQIARGLSAAMDLIYQYPEMNNREDLMAFLSECHFLKKDDANDNDETHISQDHR